MATVAVKIMYNTAGSPPPYSFSYVEFYDYEVKDIPIYPRKTSQIRKLGTGKPKFRNHNGFNRIVITFNLQSTNDTASTLKKLKTLRDRDDDLFVIYYKRIDDSDVYRMCTFDRSQIPDDMAIAGMCSGGEELTVEFLEIDKTSDIVGEDAATTLFTTKFNRILFNWDNLSDDKHYMLDSSFGTVWSSSVDVGGNYRFAVDYRNSCFYCIENNILKKRSLITGILMASNSSVDAQRVLNVNEKGYVWSINNSPNKYVRLWSQNLSSAKLFTLKAGNALNDYINHGCVTYDGLYIYLTGNYQAGVTGYNIISKYAIASLDGGDPEWSIDLGQYKADQVAVDVDGNVFVTAYDVSPGQIRKLSKTNGAVLAGPVDGASYGRIMCYCENNNTLYSPYSTNQFRQYNGDSLATIATTAAISGGRAFCCFVDGDQENLFAGTYNTGAPGILIYDITSNWSGGETPDDTRKIADNSYHTFIGDPTGYLNRMFERYKS